MEVLELLKKVIVVKSAMGAEKKSYNDNKMIMLGDFETRAFSIACRPFLP